MGLEFYQRVRLLLATGSEAQQRKVRGGKAEENHAGSTGGIATDGASTDYVSTTFQLLAVVAIGIFIFEADAEAGAGGKGLARRALDTRSGSAHDLAVIVEASTDASSVGEEGRLNAFVRTAEVDRLTEIAVANFADLGAATAIGATLFSLLASIARGGLRNAGRELNEGDRQD